MTGFRNIEIEELSNELLSKHLIYIFKELNYSLRTYPLHRLKEKGIDFKYEIETRESQSKTEGFFNAQNKGTFDKVTILKTGTNKGKISFKLDDVRQIEYFCNELDEPLIFFLCDLKNNNIYWYPIQLDYGELKPRIKEVRDKVKNTYRKTKSIRIYIDPKKILCENDALIPQSANELLSDIKKAYTIQHHIREGRLQTSRKEFKELKFEINSITKDLEPIQAIATIAKKIGHFNVLPIHILRGIYPFYNGDKEGRYSNGTLTTFNGKLLNAFSGLSRKKDKYFENGKELLRKDRLQNINNALSFLKNNIINHITLGNQYNQRQCIHTLFIYKGCSCMRCSISKLNYKISIDSYNCKSEYDGVQYAFSLVELGLLKEAYLEFEKLSVRFLKSNEYSGYFICRYNLDRMKFVIGFHIDQRENKKIENIKASVNIDADLRLIKENSTPEIAAICQWIADESFINNAIYQLDKLLSELKNHYQSDQYGGWSSHHKDEVLFNEILRLTIFIEGNYLVFTGYDEFKQAIAKSIEGLIVSHQILNKSSTYYKKFNDYVIGLMLFYVDPKLLIDLFRRYHIDKIRYRLNDHDNPVSFLSRIINLSKSVSTLNSFLKRKEKGKYNRYLERKIERQTSNALLILSVIEIEDKSFNIILNNLIKLIKNNKSLNYSSVFKHLQYLIDRTISKIDKKNIAHLIKVKVSFKKPFLSQELDLPLLLEHSSNTAEKNKILNNIINTVDTKKPSFHYALEFSNLYSAFQKTKLTKALKKNLIKNFEPRLFYLGVINGFIKFSDFEEEYLKTVELKSGEMTFRQVFGSNSDKLNHKLNEFINIAYKIDLNITHKKYDNIFINSLYYIWLRNPNKFDYSKFDCYWILEFQTSIYFRKFSTIPNIKEAIEIQLAKRPIEGLLKIYFEYFNK